ncbi:hypothetical protein B0H15DRAFT_863643 [Mycena belliarum]|uniref:Uncharacterized protein n=1 Tax=Mycena belliarum TaxID=1033014 RepID=A0AAD6TSV6_9AGAR|nr:hypothetical protein B0H15DRAFT_863643 [Mycena belliae]
MSWFLLLFYLVNTIIARTQTPLLANIADEWGLNAPPNPNSTGHLVFDTVSSLLQHWPNTQYHTGHTIVPGTISTGTLLYHGRGDAHPPTASEWVSTDPEFGRLFCTKIESCWLLTFIATRPLRVLYFDGSSATKAPDGPMDTQDLLAWGVVSPECANVSWEYRRMERLCSMGGFDAYVRMQLNFEIMLCSFTDGVQIASGSHLEAEPIFPHHGYAFVHSSKWHDSYPGETRIQLDLTQLVSLYDVELAPSLVAHRAGQPRHAHRLLGIDERDTAAVLERVRAITFGPGIGSGVDWQAQFQVIRHRYATRLELLQLTLDNGAAEHAFHQLQILLTPYRLRSAIPPPAGRDTAWAGPVFRACAQGHTAFTESMQAAFTASEWLLLSTMQETTREICRVLVRMWADGVLALRGSSAIPDSLAPKWKTEVDALVGWLGWSEWTKCRPACAPDESCYLPGAPFSMEQWNVTEPRCIRLIEPYSGLRSLASARAF